MVGCPLAAAVLSCRAQSDRWVAPHLAVRTWFDCVRWTCRVTQPVQRIPLWPASWLPAVDNSWGSKSAEVLKVWEIYDDRLHFLTGSDALLLDDSKRLDDVSRAWTIWPGAAEAALADAFRFAGGLVTTGGLVLGRGTALFRVVRLGEHKMRSNVADAHEAGGVFMYRDSSIAPFLDLRRRFKAVMDVLDSMIRNAVSLARSVKLIVQWDKILAAGPLHPVTLDDFHAVPGTGLGEFHHIVGSVHRMLCDFTQRVVVHRGNEAIRGWRNWLREDPLVHTYKWLRPDTVLLAPFLQCKPHLTPGFFGSWLIWLGLTRNSERLGFASLLLPLWAKESQP